MGRGRDRFATRKLQLAYPRDPVTFGLPLFYYVSHDLEQILQIGRRRVLRQLVDESLHLSLGMQNNGLTIIEVMVDEKQALWQTQERSEEHTSELQSQSNIVCRLLL